MKGLKECPCGEIPNALSVTDAGQGGKWALVSGFCCGEWMLEFRTNYHGIETSECMELAIECWNETKRG